MLDLYDFEWTLNCILKTILFHSYTQQTSYIASYYMHSKSFFFIRNSMRLNNFPTQVILYVITHPYWAESSTLDGVSIYNTWLGSIHLKDHPLLYTSLMGERERNENSEERINIKFYHTCHVAIASKYQFLN